MPQSTLLMHYYKQIQFIAQVDRKDKILGKIEKWEAHKKGILHRGFTAILTYNNQFILQHRKHPVFDGVFDFSFSSHPLCHPELARPSNPPIRRGSGISGSDSKKQMLKRAIVLNDSERIQHDKIGLQTMEKAIYDGLKREWNLEKKDLISQPKFLKKIYYEAEDPNSNYIEHEIDYIYHVELKIQPKANLDYSYGFRLVKKLEIGNWKPVYQNFRSVQGHEPISDLVHRLEINFAPWVKVMLEEKMI